MTPSVDVDLVVDGAGAVNVAATIDADEGGDEVQGAGAVNVEGYDHVNDHGAARRQRRRHRHRLTSPGLLGLGGSIRGACYRRGVRLLHTSDWHLGHLLHDLPREREHAAFLGWLLELIVAERIDALVITGDVFDSGNPPASAQAAWFGFLAEAHRRRPAMTIVAIAGNHDSPSRMVAPAPLYAGIRAHVVGALPRTSSAAGGKLALERLLVPLTGADGEVAAWAVAVPFLRPFDLEGEPGEAVRDVYRQALAAARAVRRPGQALVALGHLHLTRGQGPSAARAGVPCRDRTGSSVPDRSIEDTGLDSGQLCEVSPGSERRLGAAGGLEAVDGQLGELFADVAYVALGHLHKAQKVGGDHVRYAGSPIPLAMAEADYRHQIAIVELDGERMSGIRTVPVPRTVELYRIPRRAAAPLAEVLVELAGLEPARPGEDADARPFLEVRVRLAGPTPHLRAQVEAATAGKRPRLVKITSEAAGDGRALAEAMPAELLADLDPREVLRRRWHRAHDGELPAELLAAFERLLAEVEAPP